VNHVFFDPYPVQWACGLGGGTLCTIAESLSLLLIRHEDYIESATTGI
jgi:hypothetical protein